MELFSEFIVGISVLLLGIFVTAYITDSQLIYKDNCTCKVLTVDNIQYNGKCTINKSGDIKMENGRLKISSDDIKELSFEIKINKGED
jgi:hypothetical protein